VSAVAGLRQQPAQLVKLDMSFAVTAPARAPIRPRVVLDRLENATGSPARAKAPDHARAQGASVDVYRQPPGLSQPETEELPRSWQSATLGDDCGSSPVAVDG
jgi:hypothetical protein